MRGAAKAPTRRDVRRDGKFPSQDSPTHSPVPGNTHYLHPYYLNRTRRGQVGTHTVLPQYL